MPSKCAYCRRYPCTCGAEDYEEEKKAEAREMPFAYNSHVVYALRDPSRRTSTFRFYLGLEHQGDVEITDLQLDLLEVRPFEDPMPLIWSLFTGEVVLEDLIAAKQRPKRVYEISPDARYVSQVEYGGTAKRKL